MRQPYDYFAEGIAEMNVESGGRLRRVSGMYGEVWRMMRDLVAWRIDTLYDIMRYKRRSSMTRTLTSCLNNARI